MEAGVGRVPLGDELILCSLALRETLGGTHLDTALARLPASGAVDSDRAVRDMTYGAVRQLGLLQFLAARLNARKPAPLLGALQLVAIAQLLDGRRAAAIVIDQAVSAAGRLPEGIGNRFSSGFLNATLRRFTRERDPLLVLADQDEQAHFNHPSWWIDAVRQAWPHEWQQILATSLTHAPLTLRVNRRNLRELLAETPSAPIQPSASGEPPAVADTARVDPVLADPVLADRVLADQVLAVSRHLAAAGFANRRVGDEALVLEQAVNVQRLPGFAAGVLTVQDAGAQLAAPLLRVEAGERVLDACAAPGGKTTHLLQLSDCKVLALDQDAQRIVRVQENLRRERLPVHPVWPPDSWGAVVQVADATQPATWWDGQAFDRILLDAPCSASGIVRRHPDVPWHRRRRDIATLAARQRALLEALWPLLRPGGTLLYVTCSIFPEEGEEVISAFCSHQVDCVRQTVAISWLDGQLSQLLPLSNDTREHDGFFYALLSKNS